MSQWTVDTLREHLRVVREDDLKAATFQTKETADAEFKSLAAKLEAVTTLVTKIEARNDGSEKLFKYIGMGLTALVALLAIGAFVFNRTV
jgi:hypothetical protein